MALMSKAEKLHLSLAEEEARAHTHSRIEAKNRHVRYTQKFHSVVDRVRVLRLLGAFQGEDHLNIGEDYNLEHENSG